MSESVSLPALGESVTEGTVTRWLKNVGDRVEVDEPLLEVSTDKVDTEIPSPISGVVEAILVQEDETVAVGTVLAHIGDGSGAGAAPAAPAASTPCTRAAATDVAGHSNNNGLSSSWSDSVTHTCPARICSTARSPRASRSPTRGSS